MQYMGSKNRIAKELVPIIQSYINENTKGYLEPFNGGANIIDKIKCDNKIGCDIHKHLIALLKHVQEKVDDLPETILFEEYTKVKDSFNKKDGNYEDWYYGLVGFCGSFSNKFFNGYARNSKEDVNGQRVKQSIKNLIKQAPNLKDIKFECCDFRNLPKDEIKGHIIYCDPPYRNTTQYKTETFPYEEYYEWVREMSKDNIVLCSEYWMPDDFTCIWQKETKALIDSNKKSDDKKNIRVEKLYICENR